MENRGERRHFEDLNNPLEEKRGGTVVEPFGGNVRLPLTSVTRGQFV
jgi:hypothetical protein